MNDWHKWSERKPTEADARGGWIEYAWADGSRDFSDRFEGWMIPPDFWRTPTPLPGEEESNDDSAAVKRDALRWREFRCNHGQEVDLSTGPGVPKNMVITINCTGCERYLESGAPDYPATLDAVMDAEIASGEDGQKLPHCCECDVSFPCYGYQSKPCIRESGPAVADSPGAAPLQEGAAPAAAGSDAVRVLEAVVEATRSRMASLFLETGHRDVRYHVAIDTHLTMHAALAAVRAQEEGK